MKKIVIFLLICLCTNAKILGQNLYESAWIDKQNETILMTIERENGKYWMNFPGTKFEVLDGEKPYVIMNGKQARIKIDQESGVLIFNGFKYIPEFKSKKRRFSGRWKSTSDDRKFDIKLINGGITWDIIDGDKKPIRFYPKLTDEGFWFTFGKKQLFFTMNDGVIIDDDGNSYIRIDRT